jgi:hypothetical protein
VKRRQAQLASVPVARLINSRWCVAIHEAGHATAHLALGGSVRQVSVRRAPDSKGRCLMADELGPWETAVVYLAGPATGVFLDTDLSEAHLDAAAWSFGADDHHDGPMARALADTHNFDIGDAAEAAAEIIASRWAAVQAVARALRGSQRGIVSGDRVAEIVARSPVTRPAHPSA